MSEILKVLFIGFITIVVTSVMVIGIFVCKDNVIEKHDDKVWNNGYCTCGGSWEYEQAVGHRYDTSYIYVCNRCDKRIEIAEMR